MAGPTGLEEQNISLNLGQSLDQKTEAFVQDMNTLEVKENLITDKERRLAKRYGTVELPTDVITDFPNPLTIGASPIPSGTFSHRDQILMQNKGALYSYSEDAEAWRFVGHHYPVEASASTIVANETYLFSQNMGKVGNIVVYTYVAFESVGVVSLRYTVIDESDGTRLIFDQVVPTVANALCPKVVTFTDSAFLLWIEGTNVRIQEIDLDDGSLIGSATNLQTNYDSGNSHVSPLEWVWTDQSGVGERVFISYYRTGGTGNIRVFSILDDGTIDATMGAWNPTTTFANQGMGFTYSAGTSRLFLAVPSEISFGSSTGSLNVDAASFTSSGITGTASFTQSYAGAWGEAGAHTVICDHPFVAGQVCVYFDSIYQSDINNLVYYGSRINEAIVTASAGVSSRLVANGLLLRGKAIVDSTIRQTVYLPCEYASPDLGTSFLIDIFKGKVEPVSSQQAAYSQVKILPGEVVSYSIGGSSFVPFPIGVSDVIDFGDGNYAWPLLRKGAIAFAQEGFLNTNVSQFTTCVARIDVSLIPADTASTEFVANGTHLSGGYLGYYDGSTYSEHGFMIPPDLREVFAQDSTERIIFSVKQPGSAGTPQILSFSFLGGASMLPGPAYINFQLLGPGGTGVTGYRIWYSIDGVGTAPAIAGVLVEVPIRSVDTAETVMQKTIARLSVATTFSTRGIITVTSPTSFDLTCQANGDPAEDPSAANFTSSQEGPDAGDYTYTHVLNFIDANGNLFRSSPATTITISKTGDYPIYYNFLAPPVTNRLCALVGVEIYRTEDGGTVLKRITPYPLSVRLNPNEMTYSYMDIRKDSEIANEEQLYTTGGVLPNYSLPACKNVSQFKGRLMVSGMDETSVYYSKPAVPLTPMEFAEVLFLALPEDGQAITGHKQMDDKLVTFKEKKAIYFAGDGANALGEQSTFSQPNTIASDVGCMNQNSIEETPLGLFFRSRMGIQLLERSVTMNYIGSDVKNFNGQTVAKALVLRDDNKVREIRFLLNESTQALVYDYLSAKWGSFTNYAGSDACLWRGNYAFVKDGVVRVEDKSRWVDGEDLTEYNQLLETAWLKISGVQDFQRVWRMMLLGQLKSRHTLNVKMYYDYDYTAFDEYTFDSTLISGGTGQDASVYEPEFHLKRQKCDALKIRVTVIPDDTSPGTSEGLLLVDMSFLVGLKRGLNKVSAAKKL